MRKADEVFLFEQTIREKKAERQNYKNKTGTKGGRGGKMYLPTDLMSRSEKLKHTKAGKVTVSNIYDELLKREEFEQLEEHEQRNRIQYWRSKYSTKEIQKGMGIASATFYGYIDKLGLPKNQRGRRKGATTNKPAPAKKQQTPAEQQQTPAVAQQATTSQAEPQQAVLVLNGLNIAYNGIYKAEQIRKMFNKLDILLDSEESDFEIELTIKEKGKGARRQ